MSATTPQKRRPPFTVSNETFETVFGIVHTMLVVNLGLVVANLPLLVFMFAVPDSLTFWPTLLLLSLTLAPSLTGAFGTFRTMRDPDRTAPLLAFWRAYRRNLLRSSILGVGTGVIIASLLLDAMLVRQTPVAALVLPTVVILALVVLATAITALAGFALFDDVPARAIVRASVHLAVARWYFSLLSLVLVGSIAAIVVAQPVLGPFLAPGVLLYAAWGGAHFAFVRALESGRCWLDAERACSREPLARE